MKRFSLIITILFTLLICISAQSETVSTVRIGYINRAAVIDSLPETAEAKQQLQLLTAEYTRQYNEMYNEYSQKVKKYLEEGEDMIEPIRRARQSEITERESRMNIYHKRYTEDIESQRKRLMSPIEQRVDEAIKAVAEKEGIAIIFDQGTPVYMSAQCIDITPEVKKILGIL